MNNFFQRLVSCCLVTPALVYLCAYTSPCTSSDAHYSLIINIEPPPLYAKNTALDTYIQSFVDSALPQLSLHTTKLIIAYAYNHQEREKIQDSIKTPLRFHRLAQGISGTTLMCGLAQTAYSTVACATGQIHLAPVATFGTNEELYYLLGGSFSITAALTLGSVAIFAKTKPVASLLSALLPPLLLTGTLSYAAMTGGGTSASPPDPEGSLKILLAGGICGTISTTSVLFKSWLASRILRQVNKELRLE